MNRLIYMLVLILNTEKVESANFNIALKLLANIDEVMNSNVKKLAEICDCSIATISRFFRNIGYDDFFHYKDSIKQKTSKDPKDRYCIKLNSKNINPNLEYLQFKDLYMTSIIKNLIHFFDLIDLTEIDSLVKDIHSYKKVATFGLLHSEYQTMSFQAKMVKYGKPIISFLDSIEQKNFIKASKNDTLVILFSLTGNYLTNTLFEKRGGEYIRDSKAKIVLITSNRKFSENHLADKIIQIGYDVSEENYKFLNNYLLNFVSDLIVYRYAHFYCNEENKGL